MNTLSVDPERSVSLVTGGAGGLGSAVSRMLAERGDLVCVADLSRDRAETVAGEIRASGGAAYGYGCDMTSAAKVTELVRDLEAGHGRLDVLVNLAGVTRNAPLTHVTDDDFELVHTSHVRSTLNTLRAAAPGMRRRRYGRIVNASSIAAHGTTAGTSYSSAKAAIEGMSRAVAIELAPHNVTVNCIAPGLVGAGMFLDVPEDYRDAFVKRVPAGRLAEPREIADVIAYLASPGCSYVTGQTILACGGLSLAAMA